MPEASKPKLYVDSCAFIDLVSTKLGSTADPIPAELNANATSGISSDCLKLRGPALFEFLPQRSQLQSVPICER